MKRSFFTENIFSITLILVSVLPFLSILAAYHINSSFGSIVSFLVVIGSTHVFATIYLLSDKQVRIFFKAHPVKLILIPLGIIIFGPIFFITPNTHLFSISIFAYILYGAYHFGAQNIGVATFISISNRKKGLSKFEKLLMRACIFCGMAGVLRITYPEFVIGKDLVLVSPLMFTAFEYLYSIGRVVALFLLMVTTVVCIKNLVDGKVLFAIGFFLSSTFLFPMYLTLDFMLGYGSFITAHGLQYLIFLISHSIGNGGNVLTKSFADYKIITVFSAPVLLALLILLANELWQNLPKYKYGEIEMLGQSIILTITLAHFWVDQYIWQMKNVDRANWVKKRYSFIFQKH